MGYVGSRRTSDQVWAGLLLAEVGDTQRLAEAREDGGQAQQQDGERGQQQQGEHVVQHAAAQGRQQTQVTSGR